MKYKIKYTFETGDSFGSHIEKSELENEWENLEIAKQNLKSIEQHYTWYKLKKEGERFRRTYRNSHDEYEKTILNFAKDKVWFISEKDYYCLKLQLDNGEDWQMWAPWCGHFETLIEVEIVIDNLDMKIQF